MFPHGFLKEILKGLTVNKLKNINDNWAPKKLAIIITIHSFTKLSLASTLIDPWLVTRYRDQSE